MELQGALPVLSPEKLSFVGEACSQTRCLLPVHLLELQRPQTTGSLLVLPSVRFLLVGGAGSEMGCLPPAPCWVSNECSYLLFPPGQGVALECWSLSRLLAKQHASLCPLEEFLLSGMGWMGWILFDEIFSD